MTYGHFQLGERATKKGNENTYILCATRDLVQPRFVNLVLLALLPPPKHYSIIHTSEHTDIIDDQSSSVRIYGNNHSQGKLKPFLTTQDNSRDRHNVDEQAGFLMISRFPQKYTKQLIRWRISQPVLGQLQGRPVWKARIRFIRSMAAAKKTPEILIESLWNHRCDLSSRSYPTTS